MSTKTISTEDAKQFLDALNDYLSNGDMEIAAITPGQAGNMNRQEMNAFLFTLFEAALGLRESSE